MHLNAGSPCPRPPRRACWPCCTGRAPGPPSSAAPGPAPRRTPAVRCTPAAAEQVTVLQPWPSLCSGHLQHCSGAPARGGVHGPLAAHHLAQPGEVQHQVLLSPAANHSSALTALHQSELSTHCSPPITAQHSPLSTNQSSPVLQVHDVGEVGEAGAAVPRVHRPVRVLHTSPGGV